MTWLQHRCLIIVTMLVTLLGIKLWTRFRVDALSFPWQGYVVMIVIFGVGMVWKRKR